MKERFAPHATVAKRRLNVLPDNPENGDDTKAVSLGRFPSWLHRKLPKGNLLWKTHGILDDNRLPTVCEEAKCPNILHCYSQKTATFLAMGKECTRACGFCDIDFNKVPKALEEDEPMRLANSVKALGLKHVVITQVARDDYTDGGASHLAKIIQTVRQENPGTTIEVLTSDFEGNEASLDTVIEAHPEIFNHNLETVRELTPKVRHKATYERTLSVLRYVKQNGGSIIVKSGIMLGLGETQEQVEQTLTDLAAIGCDVITLGQYLQPGRHKLRVKEFVQPDQFDAYAAFGRKLGVQEVYAGPFVRSSFNAGAVFERLKNDRR